MASVVTFGNGLRRVEFTLNGERKLVRMGHVDERTAESVARYVQAKAVRWGITAKNPFTGVKARLQCNESRKHFVSQQDTQKLLAACPDPAIRAAGSAVNLRTHLERIILRAGLKPWPKPWHNMRASRQTELMATYSLSTACRWLGNSPAVAARHYSMTADADGDLQRAIKAPKQAQ